MDRATLPSRWVLRPLSEPSLVHTRRRSPSRPTQTGTLCGEPSAIRVARCAKLGRSMSALAGGGSGAGMDTFLSCCLHRGAAVSYTHLRAHETPEHLVCRL